jgi:hypothetical protein
VSKASDWKSIVILSRGQSSGANSRTRMWIALVCLAVALQGAHVCQSAELSGAGIGTVISHAAPICPVCALAQSMLVALLVIFFCLVLSYSRTCLVSVQARPFWRGLRLDLRAPPAFQVAFCRG